MERLNSVRLDRSKSRVNGLEDDGFDADFDEDVNKADYELDRCLAPDYRAARVRCLFAHQDVGADLGRYGFDEAFDARIGNVLNELAGMVEGEQ